MSININSEASCRKAYLNYHCYGNTMKVSTQEMAEITTRWEGQVKSWQATVSKDENEYEFDDSDYANYKENGKQKAQENTNFDGKTDTAASMGPAVINYVAGGAGGIAGVIAGIAMAAKKFSVTAKTTAIVAMCLGTVLMGMAILLKAMHPNRDAAEACEDLTNNDLPEAQASLAESQADMENSANELMELSDEATEANEDANKSIEEDKTKFDMYRASYDVLKAKVESRKPLREDEKALYAKLSQYMQENSENITSTQKDVNNTVNAICDDMGTYQACYDNAAESMGKAEGVTEFAAEFDEATKNNAKHVKNSTTFGMAGASAAIIGGGKGVAQGLWSPEFWFGIAAIATGGVALWQFAEVNSEQSKYKETASVEIDIRKDVQDFNIEITDMYTEEVDTYAGTKEYVGGLKLEMPDDLKIPEKTPLPVTANDGYPNGTPDSTKPKKDEEEK